MQLLKNIIDVIGATKTHSLCDSCQLGTLSKLPFCHSEHSTSSLFEKIHCDLWGPLVVLSIGKYRYYACLVNNFSKYTWIIPLQHKFDFVNVYLAFQQYVAWQFNKQIKIFYSVGEG